MELHAQHTLKALLSDILFCYPVLFIGSQHSTNIFSCSPASIHHVLVVVQDFIQLYQQSISSYRLFSDSPHLPLFLYLKYH